MHTKRPFPLIALSLFLSVAPALRAQHETGAEPVTAPPSSDAPSAATLNLPRVISLAVANSPALRGAEADVEAALGDADTARLRQPREISLTPAWKRTREADTSHNEFKATIAYAHSLNRTSRRTLLIAMADRNVDLRKLAIEGLRFQVQASARRAYAALDASRRVLSVRRAQVDSAREFVEAMERRRRDALASDLEVVRSRGELAAAERLLADAEGAEAVALARLNLLIGRPADSLTPIEARPDADLAIPELNALLERALSANPAVRILDLRSEIAGLNVRRARLAAKPDISVGPALELSRTEQILGFGVTMSLPDRRSASGETRSASAELRRISAERSQLRLELESDLAATRSELTAVRRQLDLYGPALLDEMKATVAQAEDSYARNATPFLLLLETKRAYFDALAERDELLGRASTLAADLESTLGGALPASTTHTRP